MKQFSMTDEQLNSIMEASKPVPYMVVGGVGPTSPQESANRAWKKLADEMGFVWNTVKPSGGDMHIFTAEETPMKPKITTTITKPVYAHLLMGNAYDPDSMVCLGCGRTEAWLKAHPGTSCEADR